MEKEMLLRQHKIEVKSIHFHLYCYAKGSTLVPLFQTISHTLWNYRCSSFSMQFNGVELE